MITLVYSPKAYLDFVYLFFVEDYPELYDCVGCEL